MNAAKQPNTGPLAGLRVIDITTVVMGPYATQILGDHGADVIKVEPPAGDVSRNVGPMRHEGMGHIFLHANRNKRSLVLDLKRPEGIEALLRLVSTADVLVTNVRPAALARLGLSAEALAAAHPRLIQVHLVGFGQNGPYAAKAAYDDLIQGAAALPSLMVSAGAPEPRYTPVTLGDRAVALQAVNAVLAALYSRDRTGCGQIVEVPMFESLVQFVLGDHLGGLTFEPQQGQAGYQRLLSADRRPYATQDGYVCALMYSDRHWRDFLCEIGQPQLFEKDPRFASLRTRTENIGALYAIVAAAMPARSTQAWLDTFERLDIPAMPVHTLESLVEDPHLRAVGFFRVTEHPTEGLIREMAVPGTWSKTAPSIRSHAPTLGQHSEEVLAEAGYSPDQVRAMAAAGVTRLVDTREHA